jgi:cystathionine beta-lyase
MLTGRLSLLFCNFAALNKSSLMGWNFDEPVSRKGTSCLKYDLAAEVFGKEDIIPLWVADMDFKTPDFILDKFRERIKHGVFGYTYRDDEYYQSIIDWMERRHQWKIKKEWILFTPGVVSALNFAKLTFTGPGDSIIVQTPVYPPVFSSVSAHNRNLIINQLTNDNGRWKMDVDSFEASITGNTKMFILTSPHNPVGRVWSKEELGRIADICLKNNILILSDDIHCDLLLPGNRHTPIATLGDEIADLSITCTAPSKTFNVAGLSTSAIIIPNGEIRKKFKEMAKNLHVSNGNLFGSIALTEAFTNGDEWLDALMDYIAGNMKFVSDFLADRIPEIVPSSLEATFLMWLDCRSLNLSDEGLKTLFVDKAGVGMNMGSNFGRGGEGFMRMNIGTQRAVIEKALTRIEKAVASLGK